MRCSHLVGGAVDSSRASKNQCCGGGCSNLHDDVQNMGSQPRIHCNDRIAGLVFPEVDCRGVFSDESSAFVLKVCVEPQLSGCGRFPLVVLVSKEGRDRINADPLLVWHVKLEWRLWLALNFVGTTTRHYADKLARAVYLSVKTFWEWMYLASVCIYVTKSTMVEIVSASSLKNLLTWKSLCLTICLDINKYDILHQGIKRICRPR